MRRFLQHKMFLNSSIKMFLVTVCSIFIGQLQAQKITKQFNIHDWSALQTGTASITESVRGHSGDFYADNECIIQLVYGRQDHSDEASNLWSVEVSYDLVWKDGNNQTQIVTENLELSFTLGESIYVDQHNYFSQNGEIELANVQIVNSTGTLPDDIQLVFQLKSDWVANVHRDPQQTYLTTFDYNKTAELVTWGYIEGMSEYELQWVFIDQLEEYVPFLTDEDPFLVKEPVSVVTPDQYFSFPPYYPAGKVYFRVRGIGKAQDGIAQGYTPWIYQTGSGFGLRLDIGTDPSDDFLPFEANKTWQRNRVFAEEGKNKQVISYADGSLKGRQSLTELSTDHLVIVAEQKYDYEGRSTIQIMPTLLKPDDPDFVGQGLGYKDHLNVFSTDLNEDPKQYYDREGGALPLLTTRGAAKFYSSNNNLDGVNKDALPDANGYVYSQTVISEDGVSRPLAQSGPGETFHLSKTDQVAFDAGDIDASDDIHYNQFYYANPSEFELKRLFGSNVGDTAKHYRKNVVRDPNGQLHVTYLDPTGKTIATALAGKSPENVVALNEDGIEGILVPRDLLSNNTYDEASNSYISETHLLNEDLNSEHKFYYSLDGINTQLANACLECKYELEINITGPSVNFSTTKSYPEVTGEECPVTSYVSSLAPIVLTFPEIGVYTVRKKITVIPPTLDELKTKFEQNPPVGFTTLTDFQQNYLNQIDYSNCDITCEHHCETSVKQNFPQYYVNDGNDYSAQIATEIENCKRNCASSIDLNTSLVDPCTVMLQQMMDQFKPGGIYNDINETTNLVTSSSILNVVFHDEFGAVISTPSLSELRSSTSFLDNWAEELVRTLHPEKCHLDFCELQDTRDAKVYAAEMALINTWSDALAKGYLNPLAIATSNYPANASDAFFVSGPASNCAVKADFLQKFNVYYTEGNGINDDLNQNGIFGESFNLWEFTALPFLHQGYLPTKDEHWNRFKSMYMSLRAEYESNYLTTCISCHYSTQAHAVIKDPTLPTTQQQVTTLGNQQIQNYCTNLCLGNVTGWMEQLEDNCGAFSTTEETYIVQRLSNYCSQNCGVNDLMAPIKFDDLTLNQELIEIEQYLTSLGRSCSLQDFAVRGLSIISGSCSTCPNSLDLNSCGCMNHLFDYLDLSNENKNQGEIFFPKDHEQYEQGIVDVLNKMLLLKKDHPAKDAVIIFDPQLATIYSNNYVLNSSTFNVGFWNTIKNSFNPTSGHVFSPFSIQSNNRYSAGLTNPPYNSQTTIPAVYQENFFIYELDGVSTTEMTIDQIEKVISLDVSNHQLLAGYIPVVSVKVLRKDHQIQNYWLRYEDPWSFAEPSLVSCHKSGYHKVINHHTSGISSSQEYLEIVGENGSSFHLFLVDENGNRLTSSDYHLIETDLIREPLPSTVMLSNLTYTGHSVQVLRSISSNAAPVWTDVYLFTDAPNEPFFNPCYFADGPSPDDERAACMLGLQQKAIEDAQADYAIYLNNYVKQYLAEHKGDCFGPGFQETFYSEALLREYHYTLYYYDQAGSLVQTVPPAGVKPLDLTHFTAQGNYISGEPDHELPTIYKYDGLGNLVWKNTPDGGESRVWYDALGRVKLSQDSKQAEDSQAGAYHYSYTKYDYLSRPVESGQLENFELSATDLDNLTLRTRQEQYLNNQEFPLNKNQNQAYIVRQVTQSFYDEGYHQTTETQTNLRNAVSAISYSYNGNRTIPETYTAFSYDVHGNVEKLIQSTGMSVENEYITTYEYDLLSGNMHQINYQEGKPDQFFHRYEYDADNRLVSAYTSRNGVIWEEDAHYEYYLDGSIARTELGEDKVQGIDYYHTINGWKKGVNTPGSMVNTAGYTEIGKDGSSGIHALVAKDEFAYSLHYFDGDYQSIGNTDAGAGKTIGLETHIKNKGMYNGNIVAMTQHLFGLKELQDPLNPDEDFGLTAQAFQHDQLDRLISAYQYKNYDRFSTGSWTSRNATINTEAYDVHLKYDPDGNIDSLVRNGLTGNVMDQLVYNYHNIAKGYNENRHQLRSVTEHAPVTSSGNDIEDMNVDNFVYDAKGNLIADASVAIEKIFWRIDGKISWIKRYNGLTQNPKKLSDLAFKYDAFGNRVAKIEFERDANGQLKPNNEAIYTHYSRDAIGNTMAIYTSKISNDPNKREWRLKELPIYGAGRIGQQIEEETLLEQNITSGAYTWVGEQPKKRSYRGKKYYELSNHLGNVSVVINDQKLAKKQSNGDLEHYKATVMVANEYYPFGMLKEGRHAQSGQYRYGFNGKEKVDEHNGVEGAHYDYGFRVYDPRLAKFLSVDPLSPDYPWYTPYQFAGNKPIMAIDLDGLEEYYVTFRSFIPQNKLLNIDPLQPFVKWWGDDRTYYSWDGGNNQWRTETFAYINLQEKDNSSDNISSVQNISTGEMENGQVRMSTKQELGGRNIIAYDKAGHDVNVFFTITAYNLLASSRNPITPAIDAFVILGINQNQNGDFNFDLSIRLDGFPAYELWVTRVNDDNTLDHYLLFWQSPISTDPFYEEIIEEPTALFGNGDYFYDYSGNSKAYHIDNGRIDFIDKPNRDDGPRARRIPVPSKPPTDIMGIPLQLQDGVLMH